MVNDFITTLTEWVTGIISVITDAFSGILPIFYVEETGFTMYGMLMLFALAVGFVSLALGWITRLLKK